MYTSKKVKGFTFRCQDQEGYIAVDFKAREEAWKALLDEEPELSPRNADELKQGTVSECLDCETWWFDSDGMCGECGESRLSKRKKIAWHLENVY